MRKEINIREIARRCGVSPATVSRAISGKAPVREETRLKIEEAVRQAGYQTDQQRRKQQRGRVRAIGVFVPRLDHAFSRRFWISFTPCWIGGGTTWSSCRSGGRRRWSTSSG